MLKYVTMIKTSERGPDEIAVALRDQDSFFWIATFKLKEAEQAKIFAQDVDNVLDYIIQKKVCYLRKKFSSSKAKEVNNAE